VERCLASSVAKAMEDRCEAGRSGTIGGEAPERPNDLNEAACSEGLPRVLIPRRLPSRGSMACSYFIRCHVLDPRLGEFTGLMRRKASRSLLGAASGYWPFGSLALPAVLADRPRTCPP
jgi:hypothetical protein